MTGILFILLLVCVANPWLLPFAIVVAIVFVLSVTGGTDERRQFENRCQYAGDWRDQWRVK